MTIRMVLSVPALFALCLALPVLAQETAGSVGIDLAQSDYSGFVGTWVGKTPKGNAVKLTIPKNVADGGKVRYWFKGQEQWTYDPHPEGESIHLTNASGNDLFVGPVQVDNLPFKWVEKGGGNSVETVLTRQ